MAEGARVALVGHRLAEITPTGIGRYYREIATALAASDDGRRYVAASTAEAEAPAWGPPALEVASLGGPRKVRALGWAFGTGPKVDAALGRPDLVHVLHPWTAVPSRAPMVATVHDLLPSQHPEWHGRFESWAFTRGARFVADHADRVLVNSQWTADELQAELGIAAERLRVAWFGVGDEFRARADDVTRRAVLDPLGLTAGRYLVAVGAVTERKNLGVLLRALAALEPAARPPLVLAGPADERSGGTRAELARLGIEDSVLLAGFVADAALPTLVGASLALVHPSRAEGFGLPPLEAMAAGVPALASAVGAVPEVAGAAAVLLDPDDADAWAAAIAALARPDHRAALVAAGTAHQAGFTWARTADATRAVHDEVLSR